MPKKTKRYREYRFPIDAYTPETIPMARLAEYVADLATMFGQDKSVHLMRIEKGSTVPVMRVEWEAEPKVRERLRAIKQREAPEEAQKAAKDIDRRLAQDNAKAAVIDPVGTKVFRFAGRDLLTKLQFGPISQPGVFQGVPIKVGGENDPVPVHLEDGKNKVIVLAKRAIAKEIAQYLFTTVVRVEGNGRWMRHADGEWEMLSFTVSSYALVTDGDIRKNIGDLQAMDAEWKQLNDPLGFLAHIKRGEKPQ